jgi:hypothetical protein
MNKFIPRLFVLSILFGTFVAHAEESQLKKEIYGFILPNWTVGSGGAASFGQANLSAPTEAANPALAPYTHEAQSSFQYAQSRIGLLVHDGDTLGRLEFDFIDFSKASVTTKAVPRVRRAVIETKVGATKFFFGQDWDVFSPLSPFTYNWVGHYFRSGDVGFMRIQGGFSRAFSESSETTVALGLPGSNINAADGPLETGVVPSLSLRHKIKVNQRVQVGGSLLTAYPKITDYKRRAGGGVNLFASYQSDPQQPEATKEISLEIQAEIYAARQADNLGLQGLSYAYSDGRTSSEVGGFISGRVTLKKVRIFGGIGYAKILDKNAVLQRTLNQTQGPGILMNSTARIGADYPLQPSLRAFIESSVFVTSYPSYSNLVVNVTSTGLQFTF